MSDLDLSTLSDDELESVVDDSDTTDADLAAISAELDRRRSGGNEDISQILARTGVTTGRLNLKDTPAEAVPGPVVVPAGGSFRDLSDVGEFMTVPVDTENRVAPSKKDLKDWIASRSTPAGVGGNALEAVARSSTGLGQGYLGGFADELTGGLGVLAAPLMGGMEVQAGESAFPRTSTQLQEDVYKSNRDVYRKATNEAQKEHPYLELGLSLLGGLKSPINKVLPKGSGLGGALKGGAVGGGIYGLGSSEGETLADDLISTLTGAGTGAALSGALYGLGQGATALAKKLNLKGLGGNDKNLEQIAKDVTKEQDLANFENAKSNMEQYHTLDEANQNLRNQIHEQENFRSLNADAQKVLNEKWQPEFQELTNRLAKIDAEIERLSSKNPLDPTLDTLNRFKAQAIDDFTNAQSKTMNELSIVGREQLNKTARIDELRNQLTASEEQLKRLSNTIPTAGFDANQNVKLPSELSPDAFVTSVDKKIINQQRTRLEDALDQLRMLGKQEPGWATQGGTLDELATLAQGGLSEAEIAQLSPTDRQQLLSTINQAITSQPSPVIPKNILGMEPFTFAGWREALKNPASIESSTVPEGLTTSAKRFRAQLGANAKDLQKLANLASQKANRPFFGDDISKTTLTGIIARSIEKGAEQGLGWNMLAGGANVARGITDVARSPQAATIWDQLAGSVISPEVNKYIKQQSSNNYKENMQRPNYVEKDEE